MIRTLRIFVMAWLLLLPAMASAQMLTIQCADTSLTNNAVLIDNWGMHQLAFKHGRATYSNDSIISLYEVGVNMGPKTYFSALLQPGCKLTVKVGMKNGKPRFAYSGKNALQTEYNNLFTAFYPARNSGYEAANNITDTVSYAEAFALLDRQHASLLNLASKLPHSDSLRQSADLRYLSNQLQLLADRDKQRGVPVAADTLYQRLVNTIQPNDDRYMAEQLTLTYVLAHLPKQADEYKHATDFTVDYLKAVHQYVSNPGVRSNLQEQFLPSALSDTTVDVSRLWQAVELYCDTALQHRYKYVADARLNTHTGMHCPDVTFSDAQGVKHRLSDYFGKVLYIDLWATWCGPCQMEIPYMAKHVAEYAADNRVQFISISLDRNHAAWLKQIEREKPQWLQFNVNAEEDKVISTQWGVVGIPRFIVINADGTIAQSDAFRPSDDEFSTKLNAIIAAQH